MPGLWTSSDTKADPAVSTSQYTIAERVFGLVRDDLLAGRFPYGERLIEEELAERFECSRTPVREALHRLRADGHVVRHPAGGVTPQPPQASAMRELYEVRTAVEVLVVRRAVTDGDHVRIAQLRDDWSTLGGRFADAPTELATPDFVYADEAFHEGLAVASRNNAAARYLRDINERIRVLRIHDFTSGERVKTTIDEHVELAGAIVSGDAEAAAALMRMHISRSSQVVEQRVGAMLARMFDPAAGRVERAR
jgi:DNA-binding GntR family transcriptional regulator